MSVKIDNSKKICTDQYITTIHLEVRLKFCANSTSLINMIETENNFKCIHDNVSWAEFYPEGIGLIKKRKLQEYLRTPNFQNGHFRASKTKKRADGYPCLKTFFQFLRPNEFFLFQKKEMCLNVECIKCSD